MKPWVKTLIFTVIGFGGGFASGFFCHKKLNEVKFEEVTEDEMAEIERDISKKESKEVEKESQSTDEELPANVDELRNHLQGKTSYLKADAEAKAKYASIWNTVERYSDEENANKLPVQKTEKVEEDEEAEDIDPEDGLDENFLEGLELEEVEPGQVEKPHPITLGDFYNDRPDYDKITIDWYPEDNTFLDEREEVIADIQGYVGMDVKPLFNKTYENEDPDVRFVRNEQYSSDYEIIRHHNSYKEMMGGE